MQTTSNYVYEHKYISSELQNIIKNGKNVFINVNNQVLWIHEDSMDYLNVTNMETNLTIIKIPLLSPIENSYSKYNAFLYDDNTLWIGRNSIASYDKIITSNYYKQIPNYNNSVFIIDLNNLTYREFTTEYDIKSLKTIGHKYFTVKTEEELLVFCWSDLLKMNAQIVPVNAFPPVTTLYPVNWRESSICKITEGSINFEFMNEHFNTMFNLNISNMFRNYKPIEALSEDEHVARMVSVNDNCFMFLEYRKLMEDNHIIEPGFKNIYCFDFTNNVEIPFKNGEIEYYIGDIIPYRYNGRVKYIAYEWYPAGDWVSTYNSLN